MKKIMLNSFLPAVALVLLLSAQTLPSFAGPAAGYVGRDACVACHSGQLSAWAGSHHDLAMQPANDATVLADFSNTRISYAGITSTFYKKNNKFMVRTDGPDGRLHDYQVTYVFGVTPLQQYLVELDNGRLQALTIAWDTRPAQDGGQRWFHLYPEEAITHEDELHWTNTNFNWNSMCASCHSTNLQKNYDSAANAFATTWSEIDVSCEACHGPASNHMHWAEKKAGWESFRDNKGFDMSFDERKGVTWKMDPDSGTAKRSRPRTSSKEIEVCAACHSRRSTISDDYMPGKPFMDHFMPRLLDEGMYYADGQIQDEVYVYGSFLQSKMYHAGVTCSDCHEPHSHQLRADGNGVCLQCHAANRFDTQEHHFHDKSTTGALCAECHMPPRNYMVIDPRHDHSFRIPRPDLTETLGTPNACNRCHDSKSARWASAKIREWYGKPASGYQQFAGGLTAGRNGESGAGAMLVEMVNTVETPDIARASAISLLPRYLDQQAFSAIEQGLKHDNAMVRIASVGALEGLQPSLIAGLLFPLLDDPVRTVRIEAARVLAPLPAGELEGVQKTVYKRAVEEYIQSQQSNAERPEAQVNLGNYHAAQGDYDKALEAYRNAIELEQSFLPAYVNLADLYRVRKDDKAAEAVLYQALAIAPDDASLHHVLGLVMIRKQQTDKAVEELRRAAELEPANERYVYVYAVALNSTGHKQAAIDAMQDAHKRFPNNTDILSALVAFHRDAGNAFAAETYYKKLQKLSPGLQMRQ